MTDVSHKLFVVTMWIRIAYGSLRILLGIGFLKLVGVPFLDIITKLLGQELIEDPTDSIYTSIARHLHEHPLYVTQFLAIYFLFWGVIDVVLSYQLIKHRLWAFPVTFVLIAGFMMYELLRFSTTHSPVLLTLLVIDSITFFLTWREYQRLTARFQTVQTQS